jgi:hypothetical protein
MASLDIRHAYYSVPIAEEQQILLRFIWKDNLFQYIPASLMAFVVLPY